VRSPKSNGIVGYGFWAMATDYKTGSKLFFPAVPGGNIVARMEQISVTNPIGLAMERVRQVLFSPFNLSKWLTIGFCAWLAGLGERGGSGSFNNSNHHNGNVHQQFEHTRLYVLENLAWLVPLVIFVFTLILILAVVLIWLNSRGKFMFLYCVALNRSEVVTPWNYYGNLANSLFWFRLALAGIGLVITLPFFAFMAMAAWPMFRDDSWNFGGVMVIAGLLLGSMVFGTILLLIRKFTTDFVAPVMYLRGYRCLAAWKEFRQLLSANAGQFALYILFQIVIAIVIGVAILAIVIVTCCIAGCILAIPYIGTVLLLPVIVFKRAYSLYYLAQYGASYNVFQTATTAAAAQ
jgi:hypothetical protein